MIKHNERFDIVNVWFTIGGKRVQGATIINAIFWLMSEGTIDLAKYGENISTMIFVQDNVTFGRRRRTRTHNKSVITLDVKLD